MTRDPLPHRLDRTILIRASRDTVFGFFTDSERWASWWGAGSHIEGRPGGRFLIRHPNAVEASGEVVEILPPTRIVFTYGYESGPASPPGSSRVTITLEACEQGTRLHLTHEFTDVRGRDEHEQGWRYQLAVFGNVVGDLAHAGAADTVDRGFAAWSEPAKAARDAAMAGVTTSPVTVQDRDSLLDGREDLLKHLDAIQRFMPGIALQRDGHIRHCQGTVLADWIAKNQAGEERAKGTNVFALDGSGRIESVVGFWGR